MKKKSLAIEKLWFQLSQTVKGPPITGLTRGDKQRKNDWLTLALACGLQLASELGLRQAEGTVRVENMHLSGSVDVVGNIPFIVSEPVGFKDPTEVSPLKARITFDDPILSTLRWRNGQEGQLGCECIAMKVGPWNWPYSPLYSNFAYNYNKEVAVLSREMYRQFWPLHWMLDVKLEDIGDNYGYHKV